MADPARLEQVLVNLLGNAVKFTDSGRVSITASVVNKGCVTVNIADTGIGIPYSDIPRLGERFYRVDRSRARTTGGSGLGLTIVSTIVSDHNGFIRVKDNPGGGAKFIIELPVKKR